MPELPAVQPETRVSSVTVLASSFRRRTIRLDAPAATKATPAADVPAGAKAPPATDADAGADAPPPPPAYEADLPPSVQAVSNPFTGDLDGMVARRSVRIGIPYSRRFFFIDRGVQPGLAYELAKAFEDELNKSHKSGNIRIRVVPIPLPRDQLASALTQGKIDVVAAQVTIRPELQALVDFTNPTRTNISEIGVWICIDQRRFFSPLRSESASPSWGPPRGKRPLSRWLKRRSPT